MALWFDSETDLLSVCRNMLESQTDALRMQFGRKILGSRPDGSGGMQNRTTQIGTMFSGTDAVIDCVDAIKQAVEDVFGMYLSTHHLFSADTSLICRKHIISTMRSTCSVM